MKEASAYRPSCTSCCHAHAQGLVKVGAKRAFIKLAMHRFVPLMKTEATPFRVVQPRTRSTRLLHTQHVAYPSACLANKAPLTSLSLAPLPHTSQTTNDERTFWLATLRKRVVTQSIHTIA